MSRVRKLYSSKSIFGVLVLAALVSANGYVAYAKPVRHTSSPFYHFHIPYRTAVGSVYIYIYENLCSTTVCNDWRTALDRAKADGYNKITLLNNPYGPHASNSLHVYNTTSLGGCGGFFPNTSTNHLFDGHVALSINQSCGNIDFKQGVACQEVAHGWGLDHSPTGDCMNWTYPGASSIYYSDHENVDFNGIYYNHQPH